MLATLKQQDSSSGVSPFRALTLALAGTLGVGNLVGVANAVAIGGAGAIFWLWISALVAMILKYAEIVLAVLHRRATRHGYCGGAYYYIKDHFFAKRWYRFGIVIASIFAGFMILNSLSMGCIIQVNAVASAFSGVLSIPTGATAVVLLLLVTPFLLRGTRGIAGLTEWLVPIMTGGFVVLSFAVLLIRRDALGDAIASIFREAFSSESMAGGVVGFLTSRAIKIGTMRGLLSNEAGCGTAPTAHAAAETNSPAAQGVWGIVEVFVDTIILCSATALVILVAGVDDSALGNNGILLTVHAYSAVLGSWAGYFLAVAIFCFGYATVLCWANYGMESLAFLTRKKRWKYVYVVTVCICIVIGARATPDSVWSLADFAIAALTGINLCMLLLMRLEIRSETENWLKIGT
jgi:AGCS family alanine or glycine:cation symporter